MKTVNIKLVAATKEIAVFNCDNTVCGVIHLPDNGDVVVILDGGYKLGEFCCVFCAIDAISDLYISIFDGNKDFGMNYQNYQSVFTAGTNSLMH